MCSLQEEYASSSLPVTLGLDVFFLAESFRLSEHFLVGQRSEGACGLSKGKRFVVVVGAVDPVESKHPCRSVRWFVCDGVGGTTCVRVLESVDSLRKIERRPLKHAELST